jgi:malate dehydrogenase
VENLKHKIKLMKVTIVGAGNVGATCADAIACKRIASEVVLLDIRENYAEGKALDMTQTATLLGFNTKVTGSTNDYSKTAGSDVVVITSGVPRKPGMTREELIGVNAGIVKSVTENVLKHSPEAVIVIVSNPMDTMTYLALQESGLPKNRIIGMGGALDSARFKTYLSLALNKPGNDIQGMVIGGHGDTTMIPLTRLASYNGTPVAQHLSENELVDVAAATMVGGKTLTGMLGTSAWYAPGAAVSYLVDSILNDQKRMIPCSVYLEGEYGQSDICIGVPVIIGKNGWEEIVDVKLNDTEKELFAKSADAVRNMNEALKGLAV